MNAPLTRDPSSRIRLITLMVSSAVVITVGSVLLLPIGVLTLFRARRLYSGITAFLARFILWIWGIRTVVHHEVGWPTGQVVYISNHPCTIDVFMLCALRLPNTRFFLSGFLQKFVPLAIIARMMGTFFTVRQDRPAERTRIFQRADHILRRTGESVYASPEGMRVATGEIGPFNKGAFHLATSLRVPIVPIYFSIPPEVDPGRGFDARPGTVHVFVHRPIDTSGWHIADLVANKERVREMFISWQAERNANARVRSYRAIASAK